MDDDREVRRYRLAAVAGVVLVDGLAVVGILWLLRR